MSVNDSSKRRVAVIGAALALTGIGGGLALAAGGSTSPTTPATPATPAASGQSQAPKDVLTPGDKVDTQTKDVLTPGDKLDTARTDRETADMPGQEGVENPAAEGRAAEPANERAMEPAQGHEDSGSGVVHEFQGVE